MSRYANVFWSGLSPQQVHDVTAQYLQSEGFRSVEERGEQVWRKGFGALANPQFIKVDVPGDGSVRLEAWTAGVSLIPGVYGGELNPMEGVFGLGPKMALRPRVRELESRLGAAPAGASAGHPVAAAGWFPDPAGRHEQRYWDGTNWTDSVADGGQASTDGLGAT